MATRTLGTNAANTLTAVAFSPAPATLSDADLATINAAILDDQNVAQPQASLIGTGGFVRQGLLYVPNRGFLKVLPGDYVGIDASGWPILVSAFAIAYGSTSWAHS